MSRGRGGLVPRSSSTSLVSSASDSALYTTSRGRVRGVFRGIRGRFQRGRALGTTAGLLIFIELLTIFFSILIAISIFSKHSFFPNNCEDL